ncbi:MAG: phage tail tube protein [Hyphomicrobium sp.]|uniref:phage tail tube protein n=1 Tax=Hyphomicrobium sp. TaxID=82 RepID=UPI003D13A607
MANNRIAGVAYVKFDGRQLPIKGNWEVGFNRLKREGIAGQDRVHGYKELPGVPSIEGDVSSTADVSLPELLRITDATVTLEHANGKVYVLRNAWTANEYTLQTAEGQIKVRFEGMEIDEL